MNDTKQVNTLNSLPTIRRCSAVIGTLFVACQEYIWIAANSFGKKNFEKYRPCSLASLQVQGKYTCMLFGSQAFLHKIGWGQGSLYPHIQDSQHMLRLGVADRNLHVIFYYHWHQVNQGLVGQTCEAVTGFVGRWEGFLPNWRYEDRRYEDRRFINSFQLWRLMENSWSLDPNINFEWLDCNQQ